MLLLDGRQRVVEELRLIEVLVEFGTAHALFHPRHLLGVATHSKYERYPRLMRLNEHTRSILLGKRAPA